MNEQEQKQRLWDKIVNGAKQIPTGVGNAIFGREVEPPQTIITEQNGQPVIESGIDNKRQGGLVSFINDAKAGARENMITPFRAQNLEPDRNKSVGFRFGEGAGSLVRLLDNPLVRGGIAFGLSKYMGDKNPLKQGIIAAGTNMQNRTSDSLYRNQLRNLGMSDDELNDIRGFVTGDIYKNVADSYKARWNKANLGDLAAFNPTIKTAIEKNPMLANIYLPASVANTILKGELTDAQIANLLSQVTYRGIKGNVAQQNADTARDKADSQIEVNKAILGGLGNGQPVVVNTGLPVQPTVVGHRTNAF